MAHYLVRARLKQGLATELRERIEKREFLNLQPFGNSLTQALDALRHDPRTDDILWEEEDYCSPPLAMEKRDVLDQYFDHIRVEQLSKGEGWARISELPMLWGEMHQSRS